MSNKDNGAITLFLFIVLIVGLMLDSVFFGGPIDDSKNCGQYHTVCKGSITAQLRKWFGVEQ